MISALENYRSKEAILFVLIQLSLIVDVTLCLAQRNSICQEHNFCQESGVCYISAQRYKCKCPIGRKNDLCENSIDSCSINPCKHSCSIPNEFQFECSPLVIAGEVFAYKEISELHSNFRDDCDSFELCLNGGRCYTGYRNSRSLIYKCFCPKGYAGLNCQLKHAFGHDSRQIFQALNNKLERSHNIDPNNVEYEDGFQVSNHIAYEHTFIDGFGKTFLLLNTEIAADLEIGKIEFHAAKKGHFFISFIEVSGCDPDTQPCAQKLHDLHIRINNPETDEQTRYNLSIELEKMLNNSESYLISGEQGFNSYDFSEPIAVNKGSILCITQIDGRLGGILSKEYHSGDLPDLMIFEKYLSAQIFTSDISDNFDGKKHFFSVLVSDSSLVLNTIADNSKLTFKQPSSTTIASNFECVNALCLNGGVCVPLPLTDSYRCSCPLNTLGKHCEILVKPAQPESSSSETTEPVSTDFTFKNL